MKRVVVITTVMLGLLAPAASAAPFSPTLNFAYKIAVNHVGAPPLCTSIEQAVVPNSPGFLGESSGTPTEPGPCYMHAARVTAGMWDFGAACRLMYNELSELNGAGWHVPAMPIPCRDHLLWVWNHPNRWE